jgi:hypothetical protein
MRTLILLLGFCASAWAGTAEPTLAFKGVALGSSITAISDDPRYACPAITAPGADRICSLREHEKETIAGVPVRSLFWFFYRGRLNRIVINIDESDFAKVEAALQSRYGPGEVRTEGISNLKGKRFENRIHSWHPAGGSLVAQRYAGRVDWSVIRYSDEETLRGIREQRQHIKASPESDL